MAREIPTDGLEATSSGPPNGSDDRRSNERVQSAETSAMGSSRWSLRTLRRRNRASPSQSNSNDVALRKKRRKPWGLKWRSSAWYITLVVAMGVCSDCLAYQIIIPVLPYRLQSLGYTGVSARVSWLTFAFSLGIFVSTFPVAYYFGKFPYRRGPLIMAVLILEGSQILFMLAKPYAALVVARLLMGASSTVVWTVGFALICENVDESQIGRQIGFAVAGVSIGTTIAPPIGGALYWSLGWYAPFIFIIIFCFADLVARLLVVERKDMLDWLAEDDLNHAQSVASPEAGDEAAPTTCNDVEKGRQGRAPGQDDLPSGRTDQDRSGSRAPAKIPRIPAKVESNLSPWRVMVEMFKSPRGMGGFMMTFAFGFIIGATDPTLTLRIQEVWHRNSDFVGLAYLAAAAPTFFTGPIAGGIADKIGAEWIMAPSLLLSSPWLALLILKSSLAGFVVYFSICQTFLSCSLGPVGLEVAMAAREVEGMSEIHQFAAMNLSFSVSTAIGSIVGGQMYDHLPNGWDDLCWFMFAFCLVSVPIPFFTAGRRTLWDRCLRRPGRKEPTEENLADINANSAQTDPPTSTAGPETRNDESSRPSSPIRDKVEQPGEQRVPPSPRVLQRLPSRTPSHTITVPLASSSS